MRLLAIVPGLLTVVSATSAPAEQELAAVKARIMAADYAADLPALARLRETASLWWGDPQVGHLARYWSGFASWRLAMNGASSGMKSDALQVHLERALADLETAAHLRASFADAWAAAASVQGWLGGLAGSDLDAARARWDRMREQLSRAKALEPENPRVLWVAGGLFLFQPVAAGGSTERAIEIYRRMLALSPRTQEAGSPLPDWGRPEALMSLAYAHLHQATPDLASAEEEARAALRLQPTWSYVRDILLPQIEAARRQRATRH